MKELQNIVRGKLVRCWTSFLQLVTEDGRRELIQGHFGGELKRTQLCHAYENTIRPNTIYKSTLCLICAVVDNLVIEQPRQATFRLAYFILRITYWGTICKLTNVQYDVPKSSCISTTPIMVFGAALELLALKPIFKQHCSKSASLGFERTCFCSIKAVWRNHRVRHISFFTDTSNLCLY